MVFTEGRQFLRIITKIFFIFINSRTVYSVPRLNTKMTFFMLNFENTSTNGRYSVFKEQFKFSNMSNTICSSYLSHEFWAAPTNVLIYLANVLLQRLWIAVKNPNSTKDEGLWIGCRTEISDENNHLEVCRKHDNWVIRRNMWSSFILLLHSKTIPLNYNFELCWWENICTKWVMNTSAVTTNSFIFNVQATFIFEPFFDAFFELNGNFLFYHQEKKHYSDYTVNVQSYSKTSSLILYSFSL